MRMTPRVIVKKLIRRWSISSSARCCDSHALLMISWFTTMSQKNVSDNGSDWCSDTTRRYGEINYKISFAEEAQWEKLPHRITIPKEGLSWVPMFQECLPISLRKYTDLQSIKSVMHKAAHHFYDQLPHLQN